MNERTAAAVRGCSLRRHDDIVDPEVRGRSALDPAAAIPAVTDPERLHRISALDLPGSGALPYEIRLRPDAGRPRQSLCGCGLPEAPLDRCPTSFEPAARIISKKASLLLAHTGPMSVTTGLLQPTAVGASTRSCMGPNVPGTDGTTDTCFA